MRSIHLFIVDFQDSMHDSQDLPIHRLIAGCVGFTDSRIHLSLHKSITGFTSFIHSIYNAKNLPINGTGQSVNKHSRLDTQYSHDCPPDLTNHAIHRRIHNSSAKLKLVYWFFFFRPWNKFCECNSIPKHLQKNIGIRNRTPCTLRINRWKYNKT